MLLLNPGGGGGGGLVTKSCLTLVIPWTVASQTSLSMGFSREEYWSGLPFPPAGDLLNSGMEPVSCIAGRFCIVSATREANVSNVKETLDNIKLLPFS